MGRRRFLGGMRRLRRLGQGLAGVRGFGGGPAISQTALQTGDPVQRGQRELRRQQRETGVAFDAVYTAEDIGSYKPADGNFHYMLDKLQTLDIGKEDILHTAESLFHDHGPANRHGLASCWIYRRHDQEGFGATMNPGNMPHTDFRFNSMADLARAHQEET